MTTGYKKRSWHRGVAWQPWLVGSACLVLLVLAGWIVYRHLGGGTLSPPPPVLECDFVDDDTGEIVRAPMTAVPPLKSRTGELTLVKAVYFSWGQDQPKKLAYLQKCTPERQAMETGTIPWGQNMGPETMQGILVRWPEKGSRWLPLDSPAGRALIDQASLANGVRGFMVP